MKNWKDKVLGIFAGIGLMALLMGSYSYEPKGVWEFHLSNTNASGVAIRVFAINTETGEVRKYSNDFDDSNSGSGQYITMYEVESTPDKKEVRVIN